MRYVEKHIEKVWGVPRRCGNSRELARNTRTAWRHGACCQVPTQRQQVCVAAKHSDGFGCVTPVFVGIEYLTQRYIGKMMMAFSGMI